ncbi:hypothetical protein CRP6_000044 [Riemerella phage vB_RanS_CRP6]|nr:hypothetical protein [Riemerella anatipestifer]WIL01324.1 hypothetical protein CRP6_000044 [Riemerella phage vB_RanS_CRP6]
MGAVQTRANAFLFAIHYYIATPSDDLVYNIVLIFYHFIQVWLLFEHCKYTAKNQTTKFFVENFLFFLKILFWKYVFLILQKHKTH